MNPVYVLAPPQNKGGPLKSGAVKATYVPGGRSCERLVATQGAPELKPRMFAGQTLPSIAMTTGYSAVTVQVTTQVTGIVNE
jgi:hypothetical protein